MRFGIDVAQQRMPWDEVVSRVRFAEDLGFDGAWGFDHFQPMYGEGPGEAFDGVTTLTLLHVVEPGLAPELTQRRRAESIAILEARMLDVSEGSLRHVVIEALIGDPFATIVGEAEARNADLIVLGEPGKQRLKDLFVGTTTERVIRHSERPVLVVKEASAEAYRRVLVAFDLSEGARPGA